MKRMKRILTLCLVFCLTLAVIPAVPAQALTIREAERHLRRGRLIG